MSAVGHGLKQARPQYISEAAVNGASRHSHFVPIADYAVQGLPDLMACNLLDHLVGEREHLRRNGKVEVFGSL
jgi:hypothetical protein